MSYWKKQAVLQAREVGEQRGGGAEPGSPGRAGSGAIPSRTACML